MIRRPPRSTRTDTRFPYTTLFRSSGAELSSAVSIGCSTLLRISNPDSRPQGNAMPFDIISTGQAPAAIGPYRSEEHTSELQSLMRISYAVFCLKKKQKQKQHQYISPIYTKIIQHQYTHDNYM